jgi:hypothetical protein
MYGIDSHIATKVKHFYLKQLTVIEILTASNRIFCAIGIVSASLLLLFR